jgi:hypothetical protein
MSKRALYSIFLAFALLFSQQGAAWHALSHLSSPSHSQSEHKLPHGEQCTKCAAFSQLGSACTSVALLMDSATFHSVAPLHVASRFYLLSLQPYQSRAPPTRV